ncbi:hypothetical protein K501DRAFT_338237 [Backusella circina FSU 941]|nr:hypothetical protein K501DRAFT_338237 [Backusella circina FSU 941]
MKLTYQLTAALLALASTTNAAFIRRDGEGIESPEDQNATLSKYPNITSIGDHNGTWFLTGMTSNIFDYYSSATTSMNATINCVQFNFTSSSNTSFDIIGSGFLKKNGSEGGVNGTTAGALFLQDPDDKVNTTDSELYWTAYFSQVFVNEDAWENFTDPSANNTINTTDGSRALPDSKPFQASLYSKYIDSSGKNGDADTLFLWATTYQMLDSSPYQKRADSVYGVILSKATHIDDDTFNKTQSMLPNTIAQNNITLVNLNDTCSSN